MQIVRKASYGAGMTKIATATGDLAIRGLTAETWNAFAALAEKHNGVWGGCWCIYFHPDGPERGQGAEANRALKRRLVEEGRAHAALVFDGDAAVGWCEYGTPEELPSIYHRVQYEQERDLVPDYRLTCFFIDRDYRRRGVSAAALRGALDLIAQGAAASWSRTRGTRRARSCPRRTCTTAPAASSRRRGSSSCAARASSTASCGSRSSPPDRGGRVRSSGQRSHAGHSLGRSHREAAVGGS